MKPNKFKQQMTKNNFSVGHMVQEFGTRSQAKVLEQVDIDFVIIDTEHSAFTSANVADMVAWFKATDIAPFVRIPQIQYHFIARTLDAGALGIMVPNVKSGAEAQSVVNAAKYAPFGDRGVGLSAAHTDFKKVVPNEYMAYSNRNTTLICQIESKEGLDNIEDIATTPGLDVLWVGHFDLSQSLGIPGQFEHENFLAAIQHVVDIAKKHGLGAGIQPSSIGDANTWMDMGFNVISYGNDHLVYMNALKNAVDKLRSSQ
jgi:2-keto-3-deoxy-L-rhamnonate aldolase RhmA